MAFKDILDANGLFVGQAPEGTTVFLHAELGIVDCCGVPIRSEADTASDLDRQIAALEAQRTALDVRKAVTETAEGIVSLTHQEKLKELALAGLAPKKEDGKPDNSKEAVANAYEVLKSPKE